MFLLFYVCFWLNYDWFPLLEMHSDNWIIQKVTSIQSVNNSNYLLSNWKLQSIVFSNICFINYLHVLCCAKSLQSFPTLFDPMDCSPPGSSIHGILQARILEWVAMPSSRGSSLPRDWTCVFYNSCIAGRFFTAEPPGKYDFPVFLVIMLVIWFSQAGNVSKKPLVL